MIKHTSKMRIQITPPTRSSLILNLSVEMLLGQAAMFPLMLLKLVNNDSIFVLVIVTKYWNKK